MARLNVAINQEDNPLIPLVVNFSASGNNTIITGIVGQVIRVYRIFLVLGSTATTLTFQSGNTALTGPLPFVANATMVLDFDTKPWFLTTVLGDNFIINTSAGVQVSGTVYYTQA